jgi:hypothetical protein
MDEARPKSERDPNSEDRFRSCSVYSGSRVVVWFDDESGVIISGLHSSAVEKEAPQKKAA